MTEFRANDSKDFRLRASFVAALVLIAFSLLLLRFAYLQIWRYYDFHALSEENRVALLPVQAPRGEIFDRHGNIIARTDPHLRWRLSPIRCLNSRRRCSFWPR
ncbi:MAG: hypothetical protein EBU75_05470 [Betaproteobacteria bacterium]|nr:hypothetical protein [Betaproteobacteria bacterium]